MHCKKILTVSAIVALVTSCSIRNIKSNSQADDYTARIDSLIQTTTPRLFNGVILITQNGVTKYSKAFGYSDLAKKIPLKMDDNFRIQSNSKQITAVLVLKQVERGTIKLDDPVSAHLSDLKNTWADTVTVHEVLNMSAGIVAVGKPLAFKPGTNFRYSNPAYGLLQRIIRNVTGREFTAVADDLFKSLGMTNTYCYNLDKPNIGLINGYWISKDSFELVDFKAMNFTAESWANFVPAGGIISNAIDLNRWDTMLHEGHILHKKSYEQMTHSPVVDSDFAFSDGKSNYGYGVNIQEKPIKYIGHAGRGIGFTCLKIYVPSRKLDVIILENVYSRDDNAIYHFEKAIRQVVERSSLMR